MFRALMARCGQPAIRVMSSGDLNPADPVVMNRADRIKEISKRIVATLRLIALMDSHRQDRMVDRRREIAVTPMRIADTVRHRLGLMAVNSVLIRVHLR